MLDHCCPTQCQLDSAVSQACMQYSRTAQSAILALFHGNVACCCLLHIAQLRIAPCRLSV